MYEATVASRPKVVDDAAPNHVSLRRAHESYLGCDHATYPYNGNATRPKIESRFEDVNVLDTARNYGIGTFIWGRPIVFFVWGLPYSSNRHVTPMSVRGRKGLTCSIRAPHCPRFDTLRQSVSNRAQLFLAVYISKPYPRT